MMRPVAGVLLCLAVASAARISTFHAADVRSAATDLTQADFDKLDTNKDGCLSSADMGPMATWNAGNMPTLGQALDAYIAATNSDNCFSLEDLRNLRAAAIQTGRVLRAFSQVFKDAFAELDSDAGSAAADLTQADFDKMDTNKDGCLSSADMGDAATWNAGSLPNLGQVLDAYIARTNSDNCFSLDDVRNLRNAAIQLRGVLSAFGQVIKDVFAE